jgi:hypothetical protein
MSPKTIPSAPSVRAAKDALWPGFAEVAAREGKLETRTFAMDGAKLVFCGNGGKSFARFRIVAPVSGFPVRHSSL